MWKKLLLTFEDCGERGLAQRLLEDFNEVLIADCGQHPSAAVFKQRTLDSKYVWYYFSPDACAIAGTLLEICDPTPCVRPDYPSLDDAGVHLAVGCARAQELLWEKNDSKQN
jgi:hypothetical protein